MDRKVEGVDLSGNATCGSSVYSSGMAASSGWSPGRPPGVWTVLSCERMEEIHFGLTHVTAVRSTAAPPESWVPRAQSYRRFSPRGHVGHWNCLWVALFNVLVLVLDNASC